MVDAEVIIGSIGNATAILMFLSPIKTFWRVFRNKSTEDFSGLPYVISLFNCLLWVLYGLPFVITNGLLVLTINGAGVVLESSYILVFLLYADKPNRKKVAGLLLAVILAIAIVAVITFVAIHKMNTRKLEVGSLCVVVTMAMYFSPLSIMKMVIKTKSVAFMPFLLSLFILMNTTMWTLYGLVTRDIFIMIPNGVGILFGLAQMALHIIYGRNKAPIEDVSRAEP